MKAGCLLGNYKQLLDEVEQDIQNYSYRGQCYLLKPKAVPDNNDCGMNDSGYIHIPNKTNSKIDLLFIAFRL